MSLCWRTLSPTSEQDYQGISVSAEIDSVAWTDVHAALQHSAPNAFDVGQVSSLHPGEGRPDPGRCIGVEIVKSTTERTAATVVDILSDLDYTAMVTRTLPYFKELG